MPEATPPSRRWGCLEFGCVGALLWLLASFLLPPGFPSFPRRAARRAACQSNLKQLSTALKLYVEDYDTRLPPARSWSDSLPTHASNPGAFHCAEDTHAASYAFQESLDQVRLEEVTEAGAQPMLYDSAIGAWNATDYGKSFARRHERDGKGGWGNVAFADGHVHTVRALPPSSTRARKGKP